LFRVRSQINKKGKNKTRKLKKGYNQVREQQYAGSMLSFSL
jgi:hypothetical protein